MNPSKTTLQVIKTMWMEKGVSTFYKGMASPLALWSIYLSVLFTTNGRARKWVHPDPVTPLTPLEVSLSGVLTAPVASLVVCPMEFFKVKLQVQVGDVRNAEFKGPIDLLLKTVSQKSIFEPWRLYYIITPMWACGLAGYFTGYFQSRLETSDLLILIFWWSYFFSQRTKP